jgi:hypothetical protein
MKILFLDNDGVICLSNNWGKRDKLIREYQKLNPEVTSIKDIPVSHRFDGFDKKAVKVLNSIFDNVRNGGLKYNGVCTKVLKYILSFSLFNKNL